MPSLLRAWQGAGEMTEYYDFDGSPLTPSEWSAKFFRLGYGSVGFDVLDDYREVSTVWLGSPHPLIFESKVFTPDDAFPLMGRELETRKYATEAEARQGHAELVAKWK